MQILAIDSSQARPSVALKARLNPAVLRAVTPSPRARSRSLFQAATVVPCDFSAVMPSLNELTKFVGMIGVITENDKASVLLRALMSDDLYRALAEYDKVTAPDITFDELVRLARKKEQEQPGLEGWHRQS